MLRTRNNTDGNKLVIFSGIASYYGDNYAPINGMPHLAYLGQMLENEGEFGIGIKFPEGLVLSRDCQNES